MSSINERSYNDYILRHEAEYGAEPKVEKVDFWEHVGGKIDKEIKYTKILRSLKAETFITKNGDIYECESCVWGWSAFKILDKLAYANYKPPMPYNVYIAG